MIWLISDHSLPHLRQNCALPDPTIFVTIQPRELRINNDNVSLTVFDYPGENPPILFAHANSFHGRIWDQVIAHLPGRQCYAVPMASVRTRSGQHCSPTQYSQCNWSRALAWRSCHDTCCCARSSAFPRPVAGRSCHSAAFAVHRHAGGRTLFSATPQPLRIAGSHD